MPKPSLRDALLDAGYEEFLTTGYSATGVAAVAARAGAPKGSFYNHFASKEELALAVLERYAIGRRIDLLGENALPARERVLTHLDHLAADLRSYGYARGCMFGTFAAEARATTPRLNAAVIRSLDSWRALLASTIEEGRRDGSIVTSIPADLAAQLVVDVWEGAALRAKATQDGGAVVDSTLALIRDHILRAPDAAAPAPGTG